MRTHEVQRALRLNSPSVAQYLIAKLIEAGLIRESENGNLADKVVLGTSSESKEW